MLGQMSPGTTARFTILRDGRQQDLSVTLGEQPAPKSSASQRERGSNAPSDTETIGLTVQTLDAQTARRLGLAAGTQGVAIVNVEPGSVAEEARLQHGDIIVEVNRQPVRNQAEFESAMDRLGNGPALLFVNSGGRTHYVTIRGTAGR
jgi:serine protease Do